MKKLSIILFTALVAMTSCTKSKEVHPELGDGNDEIVTVGSTTAHVEYIRADIADLGKVVFHYGLSEAQTFETATMTKKESFFELTLNNLLSDTLYHYYYELFPNNGNATLSGRKTFRTMAPGLPEPPTPPSIELPTVVTMEVSEITTNSAMCGGDVTNDGGAEITERGICWNSNENPTLNDNHIAVGNGIGTFAETINGLVANTTYHVRAYATNEAGTAYGLDKMFNTLSASGNAPVGAIDGLFTINENGDQVYFSQGNLQYQASTNTWRFAENQYDYVGGKWHGVEYGSVFEDGVKCDNSLASSTYTGWIDLYGWGTSGWNCGNTYFHPWDTDNVEYLYGPPGLYDLTGTYSNSDWGLFNSVQNGGNNPNVWRSLLYPEWNYLLNTRSTMSGCRYAKAQVNNIFGVLLLPDNWNTSTYIINSINMDDASFNTNVISNSEWAILENSGVVFLPAAGYRIVTGVLLGTDGTYWSASAVSDGYAHDFLFTDSWLDFGTSIRSCGHSVRLVQDAKP